MYIGVCYIIENNNGDVVVLDWKNGVVVMESEGWYCLIFSEDLYGYVISLKGVCIDLMLYILVCVFYKVMILDKDGVFLLYILLM